jgi:hypothetical protein
LSRKQNSRSRNDLSQKDLSNLPIIARLDWGIWKWLAGPPADFSSELAVPLLGRAMSAFLTVAIKTERVGENEMNPG